MCTFAKKNIHKYFVDAFREEGIDNLISMDDIKTWWKQNCGNEKGRNIMFHVQYGIFEQRNDWDVVLEQKYMTQKGIRYLEKGDDDKSMKGCIAKIISREKTEQIKRFQRLRGNIGFSLRKRRKKINCGQKLRRRKKGEFCVVTIQGSGVESDITGSEEKVNLSQVEDIVSTAVKGSGLMSDATLEMLLKRIKSLKEDKVKSVTEKSNDAGYVEV